jgi:trimethylamine:corrinoid methyltransferase-like protein
MLNREQCDAIHRASLEILRRTGVRMYHKEALDLLAETEAIITDDNLVRFPPGLVEWACAQAPSRVSLCQRGKSQVAAPLEGRLVNSCSSTPSRQPPFNTRGLPRTNCSLWQSTNCPSSTRQHP